ncbi:50S ribosomal protein L30e-like protein [Geopyxis carbonaria]|nr:50S ribosomal protein L30e-like protein [Geopyxis carbonaria]
MGKEKKEKKSKSAAVEDPVVDSATRVSKKEKKEKKDKKGAAEVLLEALDKQVAVAIVPSAEEQASMLVPFAQPLANEKQNKKVLKVVKKGAKAKCLKRGVKEVVKALRKSEVGLVVLAADISPMDVISHIPVLCEDHDVPYMFVSSRAELGAAAATKRPTSVTMVVPARAGAAKKGKKGEKDEKPAEVDPEFKEAYDEAVSMVEKAMKEVPH